MLRLSLNLTLGLAAGLGLPSLPSEPIPSPPSAQEADVPERIERRLAAMGTGLTLTVEAPTRGQALQASEVAVRAIEATERRLSTWVGDSELAALNRAPALRVSAATADELARALGWAAATDGAFDPTCGALVEAWDLRGSGRLPSEPALAAALARSGYRALSVDGERVERRGDVVLEEGGWGKGAGLDRALAALAGTQAGSARIDLGGQLAWTGDAPLGVEVAHPDRRALPVLTLAPLPAHVSVATSGNSERAGHLLDPRTGRPAADFGSVTVLAPTALAADALATGCFALGPDRALVLVAELEDVELLVLERTDSGLAVRTTPGLRDRWTALAPEALAPDHRGPRPSVLVSPPLPPADR